jgi:hypothetical protein
MRRLVRTLLIALVTVLVIVGARLGLATGYRVSWNDAVLIASVTAGLWLCLFVVDLIIDRVRRPRRDGVG